MRRIHAISLAVVTAAMLSAGAAFAANPCEGGHQSDWKSLDEVRQVARDLGYANIQKVILEDGCYEVITLNDRNQIVGVHFDPVTLKLRKVEAPR